MTSNWNYNEFLTYLFLYCLKAEPGINHDEFEYVIDHVGRDVYFSVKKQFDHHTDMENIEIIGKLAEQYCSSKTEKDLVLGELKGLIEADDKVTSAELAYFMGLKKII